MILNIKDFCKAAAIGANILTLQVGIQIQNADESRNNLIRNFFIIF